MSRIKITAKRQATLPSDLCDDLGVGPGDELEVVQRVEGGHRLWILKPVGRPARPWLGRLQRFAESRKIDHSMDVVRESIGRGISTERS